MILEELLPWIPAIVFLFGLAKWLVSAASKLTESMTKFSSSIDNLGKKFDDLEEDAEKEHEKIHNELNDHENRIHSLEDWKKYKEKEGK